ncbi:potassium channel family protein [Kitasatospora paranensis]|uniref:Potassium channel family protein n=1 Tax=Kitasatospora paranensis TaxID=258053 RepID=A0ABW2FQM3_9ACTN
MNPRAPGPYRELPAWGLGALIGGPALMVALWGVLPLGVFGPHHPTLSWVSFVAALALLAGMLLRQVRAELSGRAGHPALVIVQLIAASVVIFATTYLALSRDGQFHGLHTKIDALYFTVVTLATVGYGDVAPTGQEARVVVMLQILYSLVFLTTGAASVSRRLRSRVGSQLRVGTPPHGD